MKQMLIALGTAALLALGALSAPTPAQAQPHPVGRYERPRVIVVPPPPPPRFVRPDRGPRYEHRYYHRHDRRHDRRVHRRDHYRNHVHRH